MRFIKRLRTAFYLRPELLDFAHDMETTLRRHDHKTHWSTCRTEYLVLRLRNKILELSLAIVAERSASELRAEAVDVANYAMMIGDVASRKRIAYQWFEDETVRRMQHR